MTIEDSGPFSRDPATAHPSSPPYENTLRDIERRKSKWELVRLGVELGIGTVSGLRRMPVVDLRALVLCEYTRIGSEATSPQSRHRTEAAVTPAERHEHMVRMALEAWDLTSAHTVESKHGQFWRDAARANFEHHVRERLADAAQVYEAAIAFGRQEAFEDGMEHADEVAGRD